MKTFGIIGAIVFAISVALGYFVDFKGDVLVQIALDAFALALVIIGAVKKSERGRKVFLENYCLYYTCGNRWCIMCNQWSIRKYFWCYCRCSNNSYWYHSWYRKHQEKLTQNCPKSFDTGTIWGKVI